MADALVAGVQYGLSSRNPSERNSLIFVKLTDSAYRAIEEYLRNGDRTKFKPTIQFLNNEGHLSIPSTQAGPPNSHVFNFSLSPTAAAEEGTFDCIRSCGSHTLQAVGSLSQQMFVQATDDVYETTRHRMAVAEEQQKKNCTRVIKPNTVDIGRKVKLKAASQLTQRVPTHPTSQHTRAVSNNHAQKPGNPDSIMRRPIRERLIHLLAVRPYKKPELLDRIRRDGLRDKEKKMVTPVLSQISSLRDNTYHLLHNQWNEVQEDWPYYTEQERHMLKRRKPQNLTPPGSSDTGSSGSGQSPSSTHPGSPPSAPRRSYTDSADNLQSSKRPGYFETADGLQSKRQRISHYRKPGPVDPGPITNGTSTRNSPGIKRSESPATVTSSQPTTDIFTPSSPLHQSTTPQDLGNIQENTVSASEMPEYIMEYTTILDDVQRRRYKENFNADYDEYKKLHAEVERVSHKFSTLEHELQRSKPGTCDYKRIKKQVWQEYQENLNDTKYHESKRRFLYLHEKLSHIKKLVAEYDSSLDY